MTSSAMYKNANKRYAILLLCFLSIFVFSTSCTLGATTSERVVARSTTSSVMVTSNTQSLSDVTTAVLAKDNIKSYTVVLHGAPIQVIELDPPSVAIMLPEDRIGIRFSDGDTSVLPAESCMSYDDSSMFSNAKAVIRIPSEGTLISVPEVRTFNVESFALDTTVTQSVNALNTYTVNVALNALKNPDINGTLKEYSIVDWGDGAREAFATKSTSVPHVYKKNGHYTQTFTFTDCFGLVYTVKQTCTVQYEGDVAHTYLWAKENPTPVAAITSAGISLMLVGLVAFTETGKYKLLALIPILFPMYMRLDKEDILDQFVRGQIYGYIKTNPGAYYTKIRKAISVKNGTLSYHLRVLEATELIKSRREGLRYRAFYPTNMKFPQFERFRLTELQVQILDIIKDSNGIHQKEIAKQLGKKPQTINYNIRVLEQAHLIDVRKKGRKTICCSRDPSPDALPSLGA